MKAKITFTCMHKLLCLFNANDAAYTTKKYRYTVSRKVAKDGACSSKDVLSSSKAAEGVNHLLKQYQINSLFCSQFNSISAINSNSQPV